MTEHETSRTLVKSAPELWAECSEAASLARHLGAFGEIRITRLEPETTVAWEGTAASGTVRLEPSGWGTRVTLTLVQDEASGSEDPVTPEVPENPVAPEVPENAVAPEVPEDPAAPAPESEVGSEPAAEAEPPAAATARAVAPGGADEPAMAPRRPGVFARLVGVFRRRPANVAPAENSRASPEDEGFLARSEPDATESAAVDDGSAAAEREPVVADPELPGEHAEGELALAAALDSLGRAHHRPYSRA